MKREDFGAEMRDMVARASTCTFCPAIALRNDCVCGACLDKRREWAIAGARGETNVIGERT